MALKHKAMINLFLKKEITIKKYRKRILILTILVLITFLFSLKFIVELNERNELYVGFDTLQDTINSLIHVSFYPLQLDKQFHSLILWLFISGILGGYILSIVNKWKASRLLFSVITLSLILLGFFSEHLLFGSKYPLARSSQFLWPLSAGILLFLLNDLLSYGKVTRMVNYSLSAIIALVIVINFALSLNLTHTMVWPHDARIKDAMRLIEVDIGESDEFATIGNDWRFEPAINYYINSRNIPMRYADRDGIRAGVDFILSNLHDSVPPGYVLMKSYPDAGIALYADLE